MLIIGHRGSSEHNPENTLAAMRTAIDADVDILHLDVRLTRDHIPVLLHDASLERTHGQKLSISSLSYERLQEVTGKDCPPTLEKVLDRYFGKLLLCIELRSLHAGTIVGQLIGSRVKHPSQWDNALLVSSRIAELHAARHISPRLNIGLVQNNNPFAFIAYHRSIRFAAVGFHRLHTNKLALEIAKRAGIFSYAYTIDRPQAISRLEALGIEGIMTDHPAKILAWLSSKKRRNIA